MMALLIEVGNSEERQVCLGIIVEGKGVGEIRPSNVKGPARRYMPNGT